ncbi:MAG: hypothetical protein CM1200mP9_10330 [Gammaproteobacteria bacterium]|nr:MAG: hypothetical protein CM1200mP9_10330 [Gammaproteobacteria bacterium]
MAGDVGVGWRFPGGLGLWFGYLTSEGIIRDAARACLPQSKGVGLGYQRFVAYFEGDGFRFGGNPCLECFLTGNFYILPGRLRLVRRFPGAHIRI